MTTFSNINSAQKISQKLYENQLNQDVINKIEDKNTWKKMSKCLGDQKSRRNINVFNRHIQSQNQKRSTATLIHSYKYQLPKTAINEGTKSCIIHTF